MWPFNKGLGESICIQFPGLLISMVEAGEAQVIYRLKAQDLPEQMAIRCRESFNLLGDSDRIIVVSIFCPSQY